MLLNGELSFAQSSRPLNSSDQEKATKKGFALEEKPVAIDGIAIYVNNQLPIRGLTLSQLQQIFAGEVTNWQQLGVNKNQKITVFSRNLKASGTVDFFKEAVLVEKNFGSFIELRRQKAEGRRQKEPTLKNVGFK